MIYFGLGFMIFALYYFDLPNNETVYKTLTFKPQDHLFL